MESNSLIGIAPILPDPEKLLSQLEHKDWYLPKLEKMGSHRKCEWLSVRLLLKNLLGEEKQICYCDSGKPYLPDGSFHISISHTKGLVAIILNKEKEVSIDIEYVSPRVERIRKRFLNNREEENISAKLREIHLLLHWSAKESLYKLSDNEKIEFKNHFRVEAFEPELNKWSSFRIQSTFFENPESYTIRYFASEKYVLTCISDSTCVLSTRDRELLSS